PSLLESLPFPTLCRGLSYKLNAARCAIQWSRSLLHLHLQATESIWYGAPPDTTGVNTRCWPLFPVDLPVHVVVRNGIDSLKTTGRGGPRRHGPLRRSYSGTRSASRNRIPDCLVGQRLCRRAVDRRYQLGHKEGLDSLLRTRGRHQPGYRQSAFGRALYVFACGLRSV